MVRCLPKSLQSGPPLAYWTCHAASQRQVSFVHIEVLPGLRGPISKAEVSCSGVEGPTWPQLPAAIHSAWWMTDDQLTSSLPRAWDCDSQVIKAYRCAFVSLHRQALEIRPLLLSKGDSAPAWKSAITIQLSPRYVCAACVSRWSWGYRL